jgi:hypothetical protein
VLSKLVLTLRLTDSWLMTDPDAMKASARDRPASQHAGTPARALLARSAEHASTAMRWASEMGVTVVPRGTGSEPQPSRLGPRPLPCPSPTRLAPPVPVAAPARRGLPVSTSSNARPTDLRTRTQLATSARRGLTISRSRLEA